ARSSTSSSATTTTRSSTARSRGAARAADAGVQSPPRRTAGIWMMVRLEGGRPVNGGRRAPVTPYGRFRGDGLPQKRDRPKAQLVRAEAAREEGPQPQTATRA